ncbi:hypothetical protein POM88_002853 [Heracleum sosnowskyi]|uniref:Uncharacterized protein n=1 Tax=Heracleum sosnowskyi TaxID=360622 RepID=A0AAD8NCZ2_9APIA|nr:hypothetical protein POM88_002853 [Heracleum sosnowskyi]
MATQRDPIQEMEDDFAMISIEDEEQGGITYEEDTEALSDIDTRWCLVEELFVKPYGTWMRAEPRRRSHSMGSKWLRTGGSTPVTVANEDAGGKSPAEIIATEISQGGKTGGDKAGKPNDNMQVIGEKSGVVTGVVNKSTILIPPIVENESVRAGNNADGDSNEIIVSDPKRRRVGQEEEIPNTDILMSPNVED